jgi:hypothetical protein
MKKFIIPLGILTVLLIGVLMGFPFEFPFAFDKTYYEENNIYQGQHFSLYSPYIERDCRVKTQLHTHTTNSDGWDTPFDLVTAYKNAGYGAIAITDHDYMTGVSSDPGVEGILFIPGIEESSTNMHIVHLGATFNSPKSLTQDILDDIVLEGGISDLAHIFPPDFYVDIDTLKTYKNFQLVEIENSVVLPVRDNDYPFGELLSLGFHVWAIGVDDCHATTGWLGDACFNKCFVEVLVDEITVPALLESLREGNFYVRETGGPQITITKDGNTLTCTSDVEASFEFLCRDNLLLQNNTGLSSSYTVKGWESFVRVRATANGKKAWSQPIWLDN